ncbi:hypothetical protein F5X96DRAFT_315198 [Biscogniauxia mediterranea]|nr:hypothetical protein F5X96DRAFT_315198 [Biscogniauxia mediterranea]
MAGGAGGYVYRTYWISAGKGFFLAAIPSLAAFWEVWRYLITHLSHCLPMCFFLLLLKLGTLEIGVDNSQQAHLPLSRHEGRVSGGKCMFEKGRERGELLTKGGRFLFPFLSFLFFFSFCMAGRFMVYSPFSLFVSGLFYTC